jgi:hypothetical protein
MVLVIERVGTTHPDMVVDATPKVQSLCAPSGLPDSLPQKPSVGSPDQYET